MEKERKSCCFIGHRKVEDKENIKIKLSELIEKLISENVEDFIVGSRGEFNNLCRDILNEKKLKYPHIKRIYIRAEFPYISDDYKQYLLENCEETYFSERAKNANRLAYVQRNFEMIDKSHICVFYYFHSNEKGGTARAYKYALEKNREIINLAQKEAVAK